MGAPFATAPPEVEVVSRAGKRVLNPWRGTFFNAGHFLMKIRNSNKHGENKLAKDELNKQTHPAELKRTNDYFLELVGTQGRRKS